MFNKVNTIVSILLFVISFYLLFQGMAWPLYQVAEAVKAGGVPVDVDKVIVDDVLPGSPASKAGVNKGDIILSVNDRSIITVADFLRAIDNNEQKVYRVRVNTNGNIRTALLTSEFNQEHNRFLTGVIITNQEINPMPLYKLIPTVILHSYQGKYDLLFSIKSGLVSFFSLILGLFVLITAVGLLKLKKWGLFLLMLIGIFNLLILLLNFFAILQQKNPIIFLPMHILNYLQSFIFVAIAIYFSTNRKSFS